MCECRRSFERSVKESALIRYKNLVTVQSQAKFQKRYKMLAFFRLFLKFYLADTPTSKMRSILEVSSEQLQIVYRTISSIFSNPFMEYDSIIFPLTR